MKKLNTKITTIVLATMFSIGVASKAVSASSAVPASNVDRAYSFYFSEEGAVKDTGHQPKEDDSSLYMNYSGNGPAYTAKALGYTYYYFVKDCSYDPADTGQFSYQYRFEPGQSRFMYNYVKENGYNHAGIRATSSGAGTAAGDWSPDSVPEAGVLPASDYIR